MGDDGVGIALGLPPGNGRHVGALIMFIVLLLKMKWLLWWCGVKKCPGDWGLLFDEASESADMLGGLGDAGGGTAIERWRKLYIYNYY